MNFVGFLIFFHDDYWGRHCSDFVFNVWVDCSYNKDLKKKYRNRLFVNVGVGLGARKILHVKFLVKYLSFNAELS